MQDFLSSNHLRVAYLGPPASFSHQAAGEAFPVSTSATLHPLPSFKDIFAAIQKSPDNPTEAFDYAVVPVENSTNGGVVQVLDYLIQCGLDPSSCLFPDVEVVAEHYLEVHHCLYVHRSAIPTEKLQNGASGTTATPIDSLNITTLYTHPQVWGQCHRFLFKHFSPSKIERIDLSSTSAAAKFVAEHPPLTPASDVPAAICSSLAGLQNNLVQLASNIEDEPGKNTTRFLIIRNSHMVSVLPPHLTEPPSLPLSPPSHPQPPFKTYHKSLFTFTTQHTVPGSLELALGVFRQHAFNLTAITTRPSRDRNWHYVFFVECLKEASKGEERNPAINKALLRDLEAVAERTCWLGSWVDRLERDGL